MGKGRAAVLTAFSQPLEVREFEISEARGNDVVVRTKFSGTCGTEVHQWEGKIAGTPLPSILGHEVVGTIFDIGEEVKVDLAGNDVKKGDQVYVAYPSSCGRCHYCMLGYPASCMNPPHLSVIGRKCTESPHFFGGYGEYVYVHGENVLKLPNDIPPDVAVAFGCGASISLRALEYAGTPMPDQTVVVQGSGPVGLFNVLWAKKNGAFVICIGSPDSRLEMAAALGADHCINVGKFDAKERVKRVKEMTDGIGADMVIEATGNPQAVPEGMEMSRDFGTYVVIGQFSDRGPIEVKPHYITLRGLRIIGSGPIQLNRDYWKYLYKVLPSAKAKFQTIRSLITHRWSLDEATESIRAVKELRAVKSIIVP